MRLEKLENLNEFSLSSFPLILSKTQSEDEIDFVRRRKNSNYSMRVNFHHLMLLIKEEEFFGIT
jgi:hypothetical protein